VSTSPREPRFVEFTDEALSAELRWQVLSFLRIVWPEGFTGELRHREWITNPEYHPYHLLYVAGDLVVSHLEIVDHDVYCGETTYRAQALTGVLTFPSFRREGWAGRLVKTACGRIEAGDADLGLICCSPENVGFYAAASGWAPTPAQVLVGEGENTWPTGQSALTTLLSDKGKRGRDAFDRYPLRLRAEV
jgi:hypothetical protein